MDTASTKAHYRPLLPMPAIHFLSFPKAEAEWTAGRLRSRPRAPLTLVRTRCPRGRCAPLASQDAGFRLGSFLHLFIQKVKVYDTDSLTSTTSSCRHSVVYVGLGFLHVFFFFLISFSIFLSLVRSTVLLPRMFILAINISSPKRLSHLFVSRQQHLSLLSALPTPRHQHDVGELASPKGR